MEPVYLAAGVAAFIAIVAAILVWHRRRQLGPRLRRLLVLHSDARVRDVVIPDGLDGHIHIDNVLRTKAGFVVVDVVRANGPVFGGDRIDEWTVMGRGRGHKFRNPLAANNARVLAVRSLVPGVPTYGLVVLLGDVTFPKGIPPQTVTLDTLSAALNALPPLPQTTAVNVDEAWFGLAASAESA